MEIIAAVGAIIVAGIAVIAGFAKIAAAFPDEWTRFTKVAEWLSTRAFYLGAGIFIGVGPERMLAGPAGWPGALFVACGAITMVWAIASAIDTYNTKVHGTGRSQRAD